MGYDEDDDGIIAKLQQSFFNEKISRDLIDINVWLWYKGCIKDAVFHLDLDQYCQKYFICDLVGLNSLVRIYAMIKDDDIAKLLLTFWVRKWAMMMAS